MVEALNVVIADDEPIARLDLREMLEGLGHQVVAEASDGAEALRATRECRPNLAILDIEMPGMDGLEVARRLAEEHIAPSLILSAHTDEEYLDRSREAGCLCYLVKPFRVSDLEPALATTMALSHRMNAMREELERLQEELETRKVMERAKGILMDKYSLREGDAFRRIQQESMNSRRGLRAVAEHVIREEG